MQERQFGPLLKNHRMNLGLTLREFCKKHGLDPGNHSKLERGVFPPPSDRDRLVEYAKFLAIDEGSDDWLEFFDMAAAERGRIPDDIMSDDEVIKKLPAFFRTLRATQVDPEKLDELVEKIKRS